VGGISCGISRKCNWAVGGKRYLKGGCLNNLLTGIVAGHIIIQNTNERRMPMSLKEVIDKSIWAIEEAWCKGNANAMNELWDPNLICQIYPFPELKGLESLKQRILARIPAYTDIRFDWEDTVGEGDTIAIRYTMYAKHTGVSPSFPVPPTGKELVVKGCVFCRLKNGKIVEQYEYDDFLGVYQQLGILKPPG
jgi:predicted ester cyclase